MRKLRRSVLRHYAESKKIKASRYIRETWHKMQSKKYGVDTAALLRNIGTATSMQTVWLTTQTVFMTANIERSDIQMQKQTAMCPLSDMMKKAI